MSASDKVIDLRSGRALQLEGGAQLPAGQLAHLPSHQQVAIFAALSDECRDGVMVCDTRRRIVFVNPAFEAITGYSPADAVGQTPRLLQSGQQDAHFYARMWSEIRRTGKWHGELCNRRSSGTLYKEQLSIAAVLDPAGTVTHYVGVFTDQTRHQREEDRVRRLVTFDALTHLPNRTSLVTRLDEALINAGRAHSRAALLCLGLDGFKNINCSIGHGAGDQLLRIVGHRLRHLVRRSDTVARMGGDEFAIVMSSIDDCSGAERLASRILADIAKPVRLDGREVQISATIGISVFPDHASDSDAMVRNADTAMHGAKALARNTCRFYAPAMGARARQALDIETGLRQALRQQEFELYYQPQVDLNSGAIFGVEALIRWNRPDIGVLAPGAFLAVAEERGLICEIGAWTLQAAAAQVAQWDRTGLPPLSVSVNLSPVQFQHGALLDCVRQAIEAAAIAPERIELEITEGALMQDTQATQEILDGLRRFGIRLSIDDFGTGYSALSYLRRLPIDKIKIDRSFVSDLDTDVGALGLVGGIIDLARNLQLEVVAEGVETQQQLSRLCELQCGAAQGYFISKPVPAAQLERFVREWSAVRWRRTR